MSRPPDLSMGSFAELLGDLGPMQEAADLPDLFAGLARSVVAGIHADACKISLLEDDGGRLKEVAAYARDRSLLGPAADTIELSRNPGIEAVVATGTPLGVSLSERPHTAEHEDLADTAYNYRLICPLSVDGRRIGVVDIYRIDDRPFRADDPGQISLLTAFAANAYSRIEMAQRLDSHYMETLSALAAALEARDPATKHHTNRMMNFTDALTRVLELTPQERRSARLGAILHDIGKIGIPDDILRKPGPLTKAEWDVMRTHPVVGEQMLSNIASLESVHAAVRHHHERWDGTGYPDRLVAAEIPIAARIIGVCDSFDAMTSDRPYRAAMPVERAVEELRRCSGTQFEPRLIEVFTTLVEELGPSDLGGKVLRFA